MQLLKKASPNQKKGINDFLIPGGGKIKGHTVLSGDLSENKGVGFFKGGGGRQMEDPSARTAKPLLGPGSGLEKQIQGQWIQKNPRQNPLSSLST